MRGALDQGAPGCAIELSEPPGTASHQPTPGNGTSRALDKARRRLGFVGFDERPPGGARREPGGPDRAKSAEQVIHFPLRPPRSTRTWRTEPQSSGGPPVPTGKGNGDGAPGRASEPAR